MKIIVAHPAQQHSYRLAAAVKNKHSLYKYITTVYYKKPSLTRLAAFMLRGNFKIKAQSRRCSEFSDKYVVQFCEGEGLLKLLALNTPFLKKRYRQIKYHTADRFAKKVAKYAIKNEADAVIFYDDCSPLLFETLEKKAPEILRITDMSAANMLYMRSIYEDDFRLAPSFAEHLKNERKSVFNRENSERSEREIAATQYFLAPSSFVKKSLVFSGVKDENIFICPYGVDTLDFPQKEYLSRDEMSDRPVKFIYVGGVKELKGIYYLLEAFLNIPEADAALTVVGEFDSNQSELKPYLDRVNFTGRVLHSEIPELLRQHDVFVFPSLGEGMSLSVLEAASCGLPLIVSENSGISDAFTDGEEGYIIPIQSVEAIQTAAEKFISHPEKIEEMGRKARNTAALFTWDAYNKKISDFLDAISGSCQ